MRRTASLESLILDEIARSGRRGWLEAPSSSAGSEEEGLPAIPFREYMAMCLYNEQDGYYRTGNVRVGKSGDFYTSSAIGSIMGDKLAVYLSQLAETQHRSTAVFEWGAGTGKLSEQMLMAWARSNPAWLARTDYALVDSNPVHLNEAQSRFDAWESEARPASLAFQTPEEAGESLQGASGRLTIVIANELLDAFPVHRVIMKSGRLFELGVAASGDAVGAAFRYVYMPLSDERIEAVLLRDGVSLREGQIIEVNLDAEQWITNLSGLIREGCLVLIDYGHEALELAAAHRMQGTLLCYKDHIAKDEPFVDPGGQDITAHVNFTACMAIGKAAGWNIQYYGTQKQFLVDQGVLGDFARHDGANPFSAEARHNRAIRQLLLSDGMSETFKVLVLRK